MRKTGKNWLGLHFNVAEEKSNGVHAKPSETSVVHKKTKNDIFSIQPKVTFNFHKKLTPKTISDLAVHPKKISEVKSWLQLSVSNKAKHAEFLLVTGPTGSGKTATVQVLCKTLSIDISEWTNPIDHDFEIFHGPNQINKFLEFLTESKWSSLFAENSKKIILVEEFPNALIRNSEDFKDILEECYYKGNTPVIFICTDSNDNKSSLAEKLFSQEIKEKYKLTQIAFNSCATSLLKNALKRAHNLVQENPNLFKTPSPTTVNAIISTSKGDIKSALNQYYFASLLGTRDLPTVVEKSKQTEKVGTKRKRGLENSASIQIMSRDESLGLFHGLGRVLNPKRLEKGISWRLHCDVEKLVDEFSIQPTVFTNFLFENYLKYFGDLGDACQANEILSFGQVFLERWVDRSEILKYSMWVSVLGLMISNEHKVSKWNQITGPRKIKKKTNYDVLNTTAINLSQVDLYYYNVINGIDNTQFNLNI